MSTSDLLPSLAKTLMTKRLDAKLSQQDVADATGIPRSGISHVERGLREVSALELKAYAVLFGTTMDALLSGEDAQSPALDPATLLRNTLATLEISQAELARRTNVSTKHINKIAQGQQVMSAAIILRFERATGVPAAEWHRATAAWQDRQLRRRPRVWWSQRLGVLEELLGSEHLEVIRVVTNTVLDVVPDDAVELLPANSRKEFR